MSTQRKMMRCMFVFHKADSEAIKKKTCEIQATRKIAESSWVVEIHEGTVDVLVEHEHI